MGITNFDKVEASGGYEVAGVTAIGTDGDVRDGSITAVKTGVTTASGAVTSITKTAYFASATVKAMLDTVSNVLWTAPANVAITNLTIVTSTESGATGTVDLGVGANWNFGARSTGLASTINLNTPGGVSLATGGGNYISGVSTVAGGTVVIDSSTNLTGSSWVGYIAITYADIA